jgi:outer membrane protein OmpA-like peptidoglycan-associated protein
VISPERIKTKGFGSSMPAFSYADGSSENSLNRRIQIVIVNN